MLKFHLSIMSHGLVLIYLYPANKMENLLELLNKVQTVSPLPIFDKEIIVVQNAGMQHWLNMSIAKTRGISLNINYALPAQFLWKLARSVASKDEVPDQSPYSREVLTWRICRLLADERIKNDADFAQVTAYFSEKIAKNNHHESNNDELKHDDLKKYQLAVQLADLFEQYLIFRPDWLNLWQAGKFELSVEQSVSASVNVNLPADVFLSIKWQAKLWHLLQQESAYNPVSLMKKACQNLANATDLIPQRISFFGINAMAPMWLDFIHQLSDVTDVHFFHLNPCADYWGDIRTEKEVFKNISSWTTGYDDLHQSIGNPLLANLGQQGREFLAMLQNYSTFNFDVFDLSNSNNSLSVNENVQIPLLQAIQHDILTLSDARATPTRLFDDSITITSAHSPLREVQGLHDWLLHQFNNDKSLTPKDVLVMCPQIENYAPYVDAVFTRGWQDLSDDIPPLPCSIADRVSKDADPIVGAFLDLLALPDSRFQVSQLLGFLRINAVQEKFNFNDDELNKIAHWLEQANIHWGLDSEHKAQVLNIHNEKVSGQFTWAQGLSCLMRGFAYADEHALYGERVLLPTIEGGDAILLGQLMLVLEHLQSHSLQLNSSKTSAQWQLYLHHLVESVFAQSESDQIDIINHAIEQLLEYTVAANYLDKIPLAIVKEFLHHHFSQPDPGKQFMVGQVTFCSMLPMRSIPFKVIAILGLNDGDFPRQRKPQAFDLMQQTASRIGDRSRRGDDRYMFLEAIISARQSLYLSFQGRNIKNNSEKQPSLVLKELFAYLTDAYGWQCEQSKKDCHIRQLPMQAFSEKNYHGKWSSFDDKWLTLVNNQPEPVKPLVVAKTASTNRVLNSADPKGNANTMSLSLDNLVNFLVHPAKYFAQQQLELFLTDRELILEDCEPFTENRLVTYQHRQALLAINLDDNLTADEKNAAINNANQMLLLSGNLPDLPSSLPLIEQWQQDTELFTETLTQYHVANIKTVELNLPCQVTHQAQLFNINLTVELPVVDQHLIHYRSSSAKPKDILMMAGYQLALQHLANTQLAKLSLVEQGIAGNVNKTLGIYFDTKAQKVSTIEMSAFEQPQQLLSLLLSTYLTGQQQALLVNASLGEKLVSSLNKNLPFEQTSFEQFWLDPNSASSLGDDPYMQFFWPETPNIELHQDLLAAIYLAIFTGAKKLK